MSKKNFKDNNPAMQFISWPEAMDESTEMESNTDNKHNADGVYNTHNTYNEDESNNAARSKELAKKETKSKRLNLLIQPSLYQDLTKIAYIKQLSVNELILRTMKEYADQNTKLIQKYDDFMDEE